MPAKIETIKVRNFRVLRDIELKKTTPLTVLIGPNGSGKSTFFDVFAFLSECFQEGLRRAWDRRGKAKELKSRNSEGPVLIEVKYRENKKQPLITYHLEVDDGPKGPVVVKEWLEWRRRRYGKPFRFMECEKGTGQVVTGEQPEETDKRKAVELQSADTLAVNALGLFAENPRVVALRDFITGWHMSYFSADEARGQPEAGPHPQLSRSGDNLANVIQYLSESHPQRLDEIFTKLRKCVPRIEQVASVPLADGRLLLSFKDTSFESPVLSRFVSDGTLKMLAYLVLLHDPEPPSFIGIEEPENSLHPRLLFELAEECRGATGATQVLATTHSPYFLDALRPEEVRVLWRGKDGYAQAAHLSDIKLVGDLIDEGSLLGHLWMEGHFEVGDPRVRSGEPLAHPSCAA